MYRWCIYSARSPSKSGRCKFEIRGKSWTSTTTVLIQATNPLVVADFGWPPRARDVTSEDLPARLVQEAEGRVFFTFLADLFTNHLCLRRLRIVLSHLRFATAQPRLRKRHQQNISDEAFFVLDSIFKNGTDHCGGTENRAEMRDRRKSRSAGESSIRNSFESRCRSFGRIYFKRTLLFPCKLSGSGGYGK